MLEQVRDFAVVLLDREGRVVRWYPGAETIFGYSEAEMIGRPVDVLFVPEDLARGVPAHERRVAEAHGRAEDDRWELRRDGSRIWVNGALTALRDGRGVLVGFAKIMRDRTDVRAQIETLENRAGSLGEAARRREVFLARLAHELRSPLAPLANAVGVLRRGGPEHVETALDVVERQIALLRRLVDDLLDVGRIDAGKVALQIRTIDLNEVLRRAAEDCRPLAEERRQTLDLLLVDGAITIEADPDRVHQVAVNLLENAVKYTPDAGGIWLESTIEGEDAVFRVEDTGIGISPEAMPWIFDLFTQEDASRDRAGGGLGLGLSVVRDLVALHGGTVAVRSEGRGQGSEFVVRLPRRPPRRRPGGGEPTPASEAPGGRPGPRA